MTDDILQGRPIAHERYSAGAIVLHWLIAFALVFELTLGFMMPHDQSGFAAYQLHKSVGIAILLLSFARLGWRLMHPPPPAVEGGLHGFLAKSVHVLLYVFMIGQPLTGWAMVSTDALRIPTLLFGTVPWPHLPLPGGVNEAMEVSHEFLAWTGAALIALHVGGALRHQFYLRNGLFHRIGARGTVVIAGLLALLAVAFYAGFAVSEGGTNNPAAETGEADEGPAAAQATETAGEPAPEAQESAEASEAATEEAAEEAAADKAPPSWTIQPGGRLGFVVEGGSDSYRGTFSKWNGEISMDPEKPATAAIRVTVDLSGASLSDSTMDAMLQGAEFFAASAFPKATWRATSVSKTAANSYSAKGSLTLKGITRPQALTFTLTGSGARRHAEGKATIDRNAFNVGVGPSAEEVDANVALSFSFDAVQKAP